VFQAGVSSVGADAGGTGGGASVAAPAAGAQVGVAKVGTGSGAAETGGGTSVAAVAAGAQPGVAKVGAGAAGCSVAKRSPTMVLNLPKKSSAIFLAVPWISREPIWASLPPTSALAL